MKTDPNTCTHCPHTVLDIGGGTMFCPCEDCHIGGLVQGREPFAIAGAVAPTGGDTNTFTVDPLHTVLHGTD